jgi:predicted CXXCH cytochrome family protein
MCDGCHEPQTNKLLLPVEELCLNCHEIFSVVKKTVHGPLASGGCIVCHNPHGSTNPYLLVSHPLEFCMFCHKQEDILRREVHKEQSIGCTVCHSAHGSDNAYLLRSATGPSLPRNQPAAIVSAENGNIKERKSIEAEAPPAIAIADINTQNAVAGRLQSLDQASVNARTVSTKIESPKPNLSVGEARPPDSSINKRSQAPDSLIDTVKGRQEKHLQSSPIPAGGKNALKSGAVSPPPSTAYRKVVDEMMERALERIQREIREQLIAAAKKSVLAFGLTKEDWVVEAVQKRKEELEKPRLRTAQMKTGVMKRKKGGCMPPLAFDFRLAVTLKFLAL